MDNGLPEICLEEIENCAEDFAQNHGICMRLNDKTRSDVMEYVPFTILPSLVEKRLFLQAYNVQKDMNLLYHHVAFDFDFIQKCLKRVAEHDQFINRQLSLYTELKKSKMFSDIYTLTIQRSDYMFHNTTNNCKVAELKQVEVNNIASSFASISSKVTIMHHHLINRYWNRLLNLDVNCVPENNAVITVARGLVTGLKYFNRSVAGHNNICIVFVVEENNRNVIDQRDIEENVMEMVNFNTQIHRLTLKQCYEKLRLCENTWKLTFMESTNESEVAVVYFRSGYIPQHYPTEIEWAARRTIEFSRAIKCPWIGAQLAGTKKVQQVLTSPGVIEKYLRLPQQVFQVRQTFVGLYSLDKDDLKNTPEVLDKAISNPEDFVLKPQLEGGGNNFYGQSVKVKLLEMSAEEREAFILMDRLHPVVTKNILLRPRTELPVEKQRVVSELGVFGYILGTGSGDIIDNYNDGHLLRTKYFDEDEGGVMAGVSAIDSPYLVDGSIFNTELVRPKL